jgi:hypothetical protein
MRYKQSKIELEKWIKKPRFELCLKKKVEWKAVINKVSLSLITVNYANYNLSKNESNDFKINERWKLVSDQN